MRCQTEESLLQKLVRFIYHSNPNECKNFSFKLNNSK
jgi:hypothetical protein